MRIGVVDNLRFNTSSPCLKAPVFTGSIQKDSFQRQKDDVEGLIKRRDELFEQIKSEVAAHKEKTKELSKKALEIETSFDAKQSQTAGETFATFRQMLGCDDMEPIKKAYKIVDNGILDVRIFRKDTLEGLDPRCDGGYVFFQSQDRELADDVASLYSFYSKARWPQEEVSSSAYFFEKSFSRGYCFNSKEIKGTPSDLASCSCLQDELAQVFEDNIKTYENEKRPCFLFLEGLENLINTQKNSPANIAEMKLQLNTSMEDSKTVILAGTKNAKASEFDGGTIMLNRLLKVIDLDELGVTKEQVERIKRCKGDLQGAVDEIEEVYKTLGQEERKRLSLIDDLLSEYSGINFRIKKLFDDKTLESLFKLQSDVEFSDLTRGLATEPITKQNPSLFQALKGEIKTSEAINVSSVAKTSKYTKAIAALLALGVACGGAFFFYKKHAKVQKQN